MKQRTKTSVYENLVIESIKSEGYLVLNKNLIKQMGLIKSSALSNYIDKYQYWGQKEGFDGIFFLTHKEQAEQLGISEYQVKKCKDELIEEGIIITEYHGMPQKEWIRLNFEKIASIVGQDPSISGGQDPSISGGQDPSISGGYIKENKYKENKYKENKEKNNKKRKTKHLQLNTFMEYFDSILNDGNMYDLLQSFYTHRKEIGKPMTDQASKRMASKLLQYDSQVIYLAFERSIENGWTGVFPESVKDSRHSQNQNKVGHRGKEKKKYPV